LLKKHWVAIEPLKVRLGKVPRVDQLELRCEEAEVILVELFKKIESVHLQERLLEVRSDVGQIRVQNQTIQEAVGRTHVVHIVVLSEPNVDDAPGIVGSEIERLLVCINCLLCL
jgi:hypothetical protein